jgi:uncharacterized protein YdaU (DUF1376 family)
MDNSMHYYQFHIGDYRRDTAHLSLIEHAIYRALIDTCFETEKPLPLQRSKIERSHSIRTPEESTALDNVLSDFFIENADGFVHARVNQDIQAVYAKIDKARESARKRWEKKANAMRTDSERNAIACEMDANASKSDANGMLPNTHNPLPNNPVPKLKDLSPDGSGNGVPNCPHQSIVDLYLEILPELPQVKVISDDRKKKLRTTWRADKRFQNMEFWKSYFEKLKTIDWLMGRTDKVYAIDFDYVVKLKNVIGVIEGKGE